jgi:hypothetical protein
MDEDERALATLERVNRSNGLLWYPLLMDAPCFRKYREHRTYQAVVSNFEERLADLRGRLPATLERFEASDEAAVPAVD